MPIKILPIATPANGNDPLYGPTVNDLRSMMLMDPRYQMANGRRTPITGRHWMEGVANMSEGLSQGYMGKQLLEEYAKQLKDAQDRSALEKRNEQNAYPDAMSAFLAAQSAQTPVEHPISTSDQYLGPHVVNKEVEYQGPYLSDQGRGFIDAGANFDQAINNIEDPVIRENRRIQGELEMAQHKTNAKFHPESMMRANPTETVPTIQHGMPHNMGATPDQTYWTENKPKYGTRMEQLQASLNDPSIQNNPQARRVIAELLMREQFKEPPKRPMTKAADGRYHYDDDGSLAFPNVQPAPEKPITVSPGATVLDPATSQPVFQAPFKPETPVPGRDVPFSNDVFQQKTDIAGARAAAMRPSPDEVRKNAAIGEEVKQEFKIKEMRPKAEAALKSFERKAGIVNSHIDKALSLVDKYTTGFGGWVLGSLPGTAATDLRNELDTIRANIGFDALQEMRNNSPTGGALGQVSELELKLLNAVAGSLDPEQSEEQLRTNLKTIKELYPRLLAESRESFSKTYGGGSFESYETKSMNRLPNPAQHKGRTILDQKTGQTIYSDGKSWRVKK